MWAIFSDKYGVWFPREKHAWYKKDPDTVSEEEFEQLASNLAEKLADFSEIWFYHNPGRFHPHPKLVTIPEFPQRLLFMAVLFLASSLWITHRKRRIK
jgi:hypothetical protein